MIPEEFKWYVTIYDENDYPYETSGWSRSWLDIDNGVVGDEHIDIHIDGQDNKSWRKGKTELLKCVRLIHKGKMYILHGSAFSSDPQDNDWATYWQSDDYEAVPGQGTKKIRRRIQRYMHYLDQWLTLEVNEKTGNYKVYLSEKRI